MHSLTHSWPAGRCVVILQNGNRCKSKTHNENANCGRHKKLEPIDLHPECNENDLDLQAAATYVSEPSPEELAEYAAYEDVLSLTYSPDTPYEALWQLRDHPVAEVRMSVASHPNANEKLLISFLDDPDPYVRIAALENHNVTKRIVHAMAVDPHEEVRASSAAHDFTSLHNLDLLARDESAFVKWCVAKNSKAPPDAVGYIAWLIYHIEQEPDLFQAVREAAGHPNLRDDAAKRLADIKWEHFVGYNEDTATKIFSIQHALATNTNWHPEASEILAKSTEPAVLRAVADRTYSENDLWIIANNEHANLAVFQAILDNRYASDHLREHVTTNYAAHAPDGMSDLLTTESK